MSLRNSTNTHTMCAPQKVLPLKHSTVLLAWRAHVHTCNLNDICIRRLLLVSFFLARPLRECAPTAGTSVVGILPALFLFFVNNCGQAAEANACLDQTRCLVLPADGSL